MLNGFFWGRRQEAGGSGPGGRQNGRSERRLRLDVLGRSEDSDDRLAVERWRPQEVGNFGQVIADARVLAGRLCHRTTGDARRLPLRSTSLPRTTVMACDRQKGPVTQSPSTRCHGRRPSRGSQFEVARWLRRAIETVAVGGSAGRRKRCLVGSESGKVMGHAKHKACPPPVVSRGSVLVAGEDCRANRNSTRRGRA